MEPLDAAEVQEAEALKLLGGAQKPCVLLPVSEDSEALALECPQLRAHEVSVREVYLQLRQSVERLPLSMRWPWFQQRCLLVDALESQRLVRDLERE